MQDLWKSGSKWTEPVDEAIFSEWQGWLEAIIKAATVSIPRCPQAALSSPTSKVQLHIFTDASCIAYAAAAYWRIEREGDVSIVFILACNLVVLEEQLNSLFKNFININSL